MCINACFRYTRNLEQAWNFRLNYKQPHAQLTNPNHKHTQKHTNRGQYSIEFTYKWLIPIIIIKTCDIVLVALWARLFTPRSSSAVGDNKTYLPIERHARRSKFSDEECAWCLWYAVCDGEWALPGVSNNKINYLMWIGGEWILHPIRVFYWYLRRVGCVTCC